MGNLFYGWWILAGAVVIELMLAALLAQSYGTYAAAWREEFGWSTTAIALAYSLRRTERGLLAPVQGWLLRRFGVRPVMGVGMALFGLGLVALSRVESLAAFFAVFALTALGSSLTGPLSVSTVLVNWFERRRSTVLALMNTGKSVGGLLVPVVAWAIATIGWRTSLAASGAIAMTMGVGLTQLMRDKPERFDLGPDGDAPRHDSNPAGGKPATRTDGGADPEEIVEPAYSTRQALKTQAFWLISVGHALSVAVVAAVVVHLVVYLDEELGYSLQTAATFFAVMTGFAIGGQIAGGVLGDRLDKRMVAAGATLGHAGGLVLLALASSTAGVVGFALLHGAAWGVRAPQMGALRADYFGRASYATIMGVSTVVVMLGAVIGPVVVGLAADAGAYRGGFLVLSALALGAAGCFVAARPPR